MEALQCVRVRKKIKNYEILKGVDLKCEQNHITGIIGNNGSGKSVLFKCICGIYQIDDGEIYVNGNKQTPGQIIQGLGVIIENPAFIERYSGYRNLEYLYGIRHKMDREYIHAVLAKVGLEQAAKKRVSKYSLGMKQRLSIAQAIMDDPELLILDEPMNGLDKHGVQDVRELLLELKQQGKTIIISSHNKEDIDLLCDDVYEMEQGILTRVR